MEFWFSLPGVFFYRQAVIGCFFQGFHCVGASAPAHILVVFRTTIGAMFIVLIAHAPYFTVSSLIFPQQFVTRLVLVRVCNRRLRLVNQSIQTRMRRQMFTIILGDRNEHVGKKYFCFRFTYLTKKLLLYIYIIYLKAGFVFL